MAAKAAPAKEVQEPQVPIQVNEPYVKIRIPRERDNDEDKVVWVNDRRFLIKRGVPVDVPESVAEILAQEEKMLDYIYEYESRVQRG